MTCDTGHVTCDTLCGLNVFSKYQLLSTYGLGKERRETTKTIAMRQGLAGNLCGKAPTPMCDLDLPTTLTIPAIPAVTTEPHGPVSVSYLARQCWTLYNPLSFQTCIMPIYVLKYSVTVDTIRKTVFSRYFHKG